MFTDLQPGAAAAQYLFARPVAASSMSGTRTGAWSSWGLASPSPTGWAWLFPCPPSRSSSAGSSSCSSSSGGSESRGTRAACGERGWLSG